MKTITKTVYLYAWIFKSQHTGEETIEYEVSGNPNMEGGGWKFISKKEVEMDIPEDVEFLDLKARKINAAKEKLAKAQAELEEITA